MMYQCLPTSPLSSEVPDNPGKAKTQESVNQSQIDTEEEDCGHDHNRRTDDFLAARPGDLLHLVSNVEVELPASSCPILNCFCRIHLFKGWQARRDSNPQHPVLETGALPVGATGLQLNSDGCALPRLHSQPTNF